MNEIERNSKKTLIWTASKNHVAAIQKIAPAWTELLARKNL